MTALSLLSARLVRESALESAAQQAELLEEATKEYSRIVQRVEQAKFPVNKTVPPTPHTVPLSIPATFLHDVGDQLARTSKTGVRVRQYSDHPFPWRTDGGPRDDFERRRCLRLRQSKGRETVHEFTEIDGQCVVRYAQARVMQRTCVECHNTHPRSPRTDWQEGDVRGVLVIIRPLGNDEARVAEALRWRCCSAQSSRACCWGEHARGVGRPQTHPGRVVKVGGFAGLASRGQRSIKSARWAHRGSSSAGFGISSVLSLSASAQKSSATSRGSRLKSSPSRTSSPSPAAEASRSSPSSRACRATLWTHC